MSTDVTVVTLPAISRNFPTLLPPQIERSSALSTIGALFASEDYEVVGLTGREGIGKTTVLAQFAMQHPRDAISIFIRGTSRPAYDPYTINFDICSQLHWLVHERELKEEPDALLRRKLLTAARSRKNRPVLYFVVDGLEEIPDYDADDRKTIIRDLLPFGMQPFRFLISGDPKKLGIHTDPSRTQIMPLFHFTEDESRRYLNDLGLSEEETERLCEASEGFPGKLAAFRRLMSRGVTLSRLAGKDRRALEDLELAATQDLTEEQKLALAIITYDQDERSLAAISEISGVDAAVIADMLQRLSVLVERKGRIGFIHESFRVAGAQRMVSYRDAAFDRLISFLLREPDSEAALLSVPQQLVSAGRYEQLLDFLTRERMERLFFRKRSAAEVKRLADIGVQAARKTRRLPALLQFALADSAAQDLNSCGSTRSEVSALCSLGHYYVAREVAYSAVTREERIRLLAMIAGRKRLDSIEDRVLIEEITQLANDIDFASLGSHALEIAADLIDIHPELSIQIIDQAAPSEGNRGPLARALTTIATDRIKHAAATGGIDEKTPNADHHHQSPASDRGIEAFLRALTGRYRQLPTDDFLTDCEAVQEPANRLFLIQHWTSANARRHDAIRVVEMGLELAAQSLDDATPLLYRRLLRPLPYTAEAERAQKVIAQAASTLDSLRLAPTTEFVRAMMTIAHAEARYDFDRARARVVEIRHSVDAIPEPSDKASSLAWMLNVIRRITTAYPGSGLEQIEKEVERKLVDWVDVLLAGTADHQKTVRPIINALAATRLDLAAVISGRLNTANRCEEALADAIEAAIDNRLEHVTLSQLLSFIDTLSTPEVRYRKILSLVNFVYDEAAQFEAQTDDVRALIARLLEGGSEPVDWTGFVTAARAAAVMNERQLLEDALGALLTSWSSLEVGWQKVSAAFEIASALSEVVPDDALTYLEFGKRERTPFAVTDEQTSDVLLDLTRLLIRAFGGVIATKHDLPEDRDRVLTVIATSSTVSDRIYLLADLAIEFENSKRGDDARVLVKTELRRLLDALAKSNPAEYQVALVHAAPALYRTHSSACLEMVDALPPGRRDSAIVHIVNFILHHVRCYESSAISRFDTEPDADDIRDVLDLLARVSDERVILAYISLATEAVKQTDRLTPAQRADVERRIRELSAAKYPAPGGIQHEGYTIAADIYAMSCRSARDQRPNEWQQLIDRVRKIPNTADQAFLMTILAEHIPIKQSFDRIRHPLIEDFFATAAKIPTAIDRASHLIGFAEAMGEIRKDDARRALQLTADALAAHPDTTKLLDTMIATAYNFDGPFAKSLAARMKDVAHQDLTTVRRQQLEALELASGFAKGQVPEATDAELSPSKLSMYLTAAKTIYGHLLSGRIKSIPDAALPPLLSVAATSPLSITTSLYRLVLENLIRTRRRSAEGSRELRGIFDAVLSSVQFACRLMTASALHVHDQRTTAMPLTKRMMAVRIGDQQRAASFIREWFLDSGGNYVKVIDPYIGPRELAWLKEILDGERKTELFVVGSLRPRGHSEHSESAFREAWERVPYYGAEIGANVILVGNRNGELPFHDRFIVTAGSGLQLGGSLNRLGGPKTINILALDEVTAEDSERAIDAYIRRQDLESQGEMLTYLTFKL